MTDEPEKTAEETLREAAALLGPGSVGEVVRNFKKSLKARNYGDATAYLDENLADLDLTGLDLTFLDEPGWGVSGRPRVVSPDSEIVLYIRSAKGALQRVDKSKPVEATRRCSLRACSNAGAAMPMPNCWCSFRAWTIRRA